LYVKPKSNTTGFYTEDVVKCVTRDNTSGRMIRETDTYVYMKDRGDWLWL